MNSLLASNKIAYLVCSPYCRRDHERFGISTWIKYRSEVLILDCTRIFKSTEFHQDASFDPGQFCLVIHPTSIKDIFTILKQAKPDLVVDFLGSAPLMQILKINIYRTYRTLCIGEVRLFPIITKPLIIRLLKVLSGKVKFKYLFKFLWDRIKCVVSLHPNYLYVIGLLGSTVNNPNTKLIYGHSNDYDIHLNKSIRNMNLKNSDRIVFLDEDMVFHRDYQFDQINPPVTAVNYYPEVNNLLRNLSRLYGLEVVIAGHPRAAQKNKSFFEFEYVTGATYDLISSGKIIVGHTSTTIQWAILLRKPIIFVTTDEICSSPYGPYVQSFAREVEGLVVNASSFKVEHLHDNDLFRINELKYSQYVKNYMRHPKSNNDAMWDRISQIILKDIRKI